MSKITIEDFCYMFVMHAKKYMAEHLDKTFEDFLHEYETQQLLAEAMHNADYGFTREQLELVIDAAMHESARKSLN